MSLWNGNLFYFENVLQAHNGAIRCVTWAPNENTMLSGDSLGQLKLWDHFFMNFKTIPAHKEALRDLSCSPTGSKFVSCADDSHAKVWDLRTLREERVFTGHGWDVKCCAWHPRLGLVATGSKDSLIKLWDPRTSEAITSIFAHKNIVNKVAWTANGQSLSPDHATRWSKCWTSRPCRSVPSIAATPRR